MSTDYRLMKKIRFMDLFDGRLESLGVREHPAKGATEGARCLTDGVNYLWVYMDEEDFVASLSRYMPNGSPFKIIEAIEMTFDTEIYSEHEPQYWGFDSQAEWEAAEREIGRKLEDEFYADIIKFVSGQTCDIREETVGWTKAQIAKQLVKDDPRLLLPQERGRLMSTIDAVYEKEDEAKRVRLTERDIEFHNMISALVDGAVLASELDLYRSRRNRRSA